MNFPNPPSQSTSSTKKTNPDSSRSLLLLSGDVTHSWLPGGPPVRLTPSATSSISRIRKGQLASYRKRPRRVSLLTLCRQVLPSGSGCTWTSEPHCLHPSKGTGGYLPQGPAGCCSREGSLHEARRQGRSLRLMQPPIDSGVSSIITPLSLWDLCLNEACFLPDAISFYPGWRLKADQWGQYL